MLDSNALIAQRIDEPPLLDVAIRTLDLRLGDGRYRLVRLLGYGGMGVVVEARDLVLDEDRAIKLVTRKNDGILDRQTLVRESRAMSRFRHPNIATVYDIVEEDPLSYLVMELVRGESLRDRLDRILLKPEFAGRITLSILDALAAAHDARVIHRDVKPSNVMLADGVVKLLDFGIAAFTDITLSTSRIFAGTLAYMAPEVRMGARPDVTGDVYSTGCTLYEMLTLRSPMDLAFQLDEPDRWRGVSPDYRGVIRRAVAPSPTDRFPSAGAMSAAIRQIEPRLAPSTPSGVVRRLTPRPGVPLIAVIDDDAIVGVVVRAALEELGVEVQHYSDAEAFLVSGAVPNLILLDVHMPRANGLAVLWRLRRLPELARTPVVMLSSNRSDDVVERAFSHGADDYVAKPFRPRQFCARIRRWLTDDGSRRRAPPDDALG